MWVWVWVCVCECVSVCVYVYVFLEVSETILVWRIYIVGIPSSAEVKERVELYLYSPSGPSWPILGGTLSLPLPYSEESGLFQVSEMSI